MTGCADMFFPIPWAVYRLYHSILSTPDIALTAGGVKQVWDSCAGGWELTALRNLLCRWMPKTLALENSRHAGLQEQYNLWKIKSLKDLGTSVRKRNWVKLWEIQDIGGLACCSVAQTSDRNLLRVTTALLTLLDYLCTEAETAGCRAHIQVGR